MRDVNPMDVNPMDVNLLRTLVDYHYWANSRILEVASALGPKQFNQDVGSGRPILAILVHLLNADRFFLARLTDQAEPILQENVPDPASVLERWKPIEAQMRGFVKALADTQMSRSVEMTAKIPPLPLWAVLLQVVTHGTHHRGQVSTILRQVGVTPPPADFVWYCIEKAQP